MARSTSKAEKLSKLERLMNNSGATAGEKASAKAAWERIAGRKYTGGSSSPRNSTGGSRSSGYNRSSYGAAQARSATYRAQARAKTRGWSEWQDGYSATVAATARRAERRPRNIWRNMPSDTKANLIALGVAAGLYGGAVAYANRNRIKQAVKNRVDKIRTAFKGSRAASDASAA